MLLVWPLFPDAFVRQAGGSQGVLVQGANEGRWPLLPGPGSGTLPASNTAAFSHVAMSM